MNKGMIAMQFGKDIIDGVLREFYPLCEIPHGSGNEEKISKYLAKRLSDLGCTVYTDEYGNVWANAAADSGRERESMIALQAHMDMVCAAGAKDWDSNQPVSASIQGGWLTTKGRSSLGADCGAGIALILWLLGQKEVSHPPLRIIFTVKEEQGLEGAYRISPKCVERVERFINLDGFASDRILVGAAGGLRERFSRTLMMEPIRSGVAYEVTLSGLMGGHSGFDIDKGRGNALLMMGQLLQQLKDRVPFSLANLEGGTATNAIPYACKAELVAAVPIDDLAKELITQTEESFKGMKPEIKLEIRRSRSPQRVWSDQDTVSLLGLLNGIQNGVYAVDSMHRVHASSNLGHIHMRDGMLHVDAMIRTMTVDEEETLHRAHLACAQQNGFAENLCSRYPAWPAREGGMVRRLAELYQKESGHNAQIMVQHVGLEPAFFLEKNPHMECVSLGMEIENCHSPEERWKLDSIPLLARILCSYFSESI